MALQQWELQQQLATILPIDNEELKQILSYADSLPPEQASEHFSELLGDSPEALRFITTYRERRSEMGGAAPAQSVNGSKGQAAASVNPFDPPPDNNFDEDVKTPYSSDTKHTQQAPVMPADLLPSYAPPSNPPPASGSSSYALPPGAPPTSGANSRLAARHHTNPVIEAAALRARDEVGGDRGFMSAGGPY